jgi:hypothetical protein
MGYLRLESIRPEKNRFRWYTVGWWPTLWDTWIVLCEWGRTGQEPRGVRLRECATLDVALMLAAAVIELRLRHGYIVQ